MYVNRPVPRLFCGHAVCLWLMVSCLTSSDASLTNHSAEYVGFPLSLPHRDWPFPPLNYTMAPHFSRSRARTKFNLCHVFQFGLIVSRHTPTGAVRTAACRFRTVFGRDSHDGITKTSRRKKHDHKYNGAFRSENYRQHLHKMHVERWSEYKQLDPSQMMQYSTNGVPYSETIHVHFASTDVCGYLIHRDIIDRVIIPFLCKEPKRAAELPRESLKPSDDG